MKLLSDRIKECLEGPPKKTQLALAKACGIEPPSVNDWISGKTKSINTEHLFKAARFLNVNILSSASFKKNSTASRLIFSMPHN